jgi:hypothetical protein
MPILFEAEAAPLLQELIMTNFHPTSALDLVTRPLFHGVSPGLQLLSLYRCRVLWSSPLLRCDLVYLSISHIPHDHLPTLQQVLEVLKRLARLECLQLDDALPVRGSTPGESITSLLSVERLFLNRLRFFSLCAKSALDILDLTARVLVPASALFQLICEDFERYTPDTDSGDVMLAAVASHLCAPRDSSNVDAWAPVRSLHVRDIPAARSWSLFAGTGGPNADADADANSDEEDNDDDDDDDDIDAQEGTPRPHRRHAKKAADARPPNPADEQMHILSLHLRWHAFPSSARAAASFIERAARLPPLVRAGTLLIESALFESANAWRATFARARHVRAVFAGGGKAVAGATQMLGDVAQLQRQRRECPQAQSHSRELEAGDDADIGAYAAIARLLPSRLSFERPAEQPPRVLFPKLRRLAIAGANFENVEAGLFASLRAGLIARREGEVGALTQLSISRCDVLKEQLDALGALVAESKVRWDGILHVLPLSPPVSEAGDGSAQELTPAHAAGTAQVNDWHGAATEPEMGHGDGDVTPVNGQSPLLFPGELDED